MPTYIVGGDGSRSYQCGIFTCYPIHGNDGYLNQGSPLTKNKSTFSDYHFSYTVSDAICGGIWRDGNSAGFYETANGGEVSIGAHYYGSRLSKVP